MYCIKTSSCFISPYRVCVFSIKRSSTKLVELTNTFFSVHVHKSRCSGKYRVYLFLRNEIFQEILSTDTKTINIRYNTCYNKKVHRIMIDMYRYVILLNYFYYHYFSTCLLFVWVKVHFRFFVAIFKDLVFVVVLRVH